MVVFENLLEVKKMKYDYIIVGSGLFGSICAHELSKRNKKVLVIEKRGHIGGNIYTKNMNGINVHVYGAHIFHTSNKDVWDYMNQFATFNDYINSPLANYHGEIYHLPFNMNTFTEIWPDVKTKDDALRHIEDEKKIFGFDNPSNLEEQAINLVGKTIYEKLVKEYTEKQWGKDCKELPSFIIKRLPLRFEFNNNYFNDIYQGIPIGGYTQIIEKMLCGVDVILNEDFLDNKEKYYEMAEKIIYTGSVDELFDYSLGILEYRSVRFETEVLNIENYQNNAVVNYTSHDVPYTRIIEHKHFEYGKQKKTVISKEFSTNWKVGLDRFYPVNNDKNNALYEKYLELSKQNPRLLLGGRLGLYKYLDMDKVVEAALDFVSKLN